MGTLYCNVKAIEVTPFWTWGMYAGKSYPQKEYKILQVVYNGDQVLQLPHSWQEPQQMLCYFTIRYFQNIQRNNNKDPLQTSLENGLIDKHPFLKKWAASMVTHPADHAQFWNWYKRYLGAITHTSIQQVRVYEITVQYQPEGWLKATNTQLLYDVR